MFAGALSPLVVRPLVSLRGWAPGGAHCLGRACAPVAAAAASPAATCGRRSVWGEAAPREEVLNRESFYDNVVETWAAKPVRKLTLKQLLSFGRDAWYDKSQVLESARFVQAELPKRLARRLMDLQLLPYIVVSNPNIKKVYNAYYHGFATLRALPPVTTMQQNDELTSLLRRLVDEHSPMLDALAQGMREVRSKPIVGEQLHLDSFLENMLRSRISRRVMAEQHINLNNQRPGYIGIVSTQLNLAEAVDYAATRCKQAFMEHYGVAPDVYVSGDTGLTIPYIPAHLDYMLYELLKNSARAVVERHMGTGRSSISDPIAQQRSSKLPPILARLCGGAQDITIRLSDQGGGIPEDSLESVWQFGYTTSSTSSSSSRPARRPGASIGSQGFHGASPGPSPSGINNVMDAFGGGGGGGGFGGTIGGGFGGTVGGTIGGGVFGGQQDQGDLVQQQRRSSEEEGASREGLGLDNAPPGMSFGGGWQAMDDRLGGMGRFRIAGLGFGLPLSRLYARYFGGDLRMVNMPGYGVDSFLTLKRLEEAEWEESRAELQTGMLQTRAAWAT